MHFKRLLQTTAGAVGILPLMLYGTFGGIYVLYWLIDHWGFLGFLATAVVLPVFPLVAWVVDGTFPAFMGALWALAIFGAFYSAYLDRQPPADRHNKPEASD